jgi:hypothetical protein
MSAAACFSGQKRLTLTVIFFLMEIVSPIVASRIPRWKKNLDDNQGAEQLRRYRPQRVETNVVPFAG